MTIAANAIDIVLWLLAVVGVLFLVRVAKRLIDRWETAREMRRKNARRK